LGKAEFEQKLVSVRKRGSKESKSKSLAEFLEDVTGELEQDA
jgi:threonyl-tRNA synthetase